MQPEPSHPVRAGGLQGAPHPRRGGRHPAGRNHSRCAQCVPAALREQEGAHAAGQAPGRARRGRRARGVTARRLVRLRGVVCASGRRTRLPVLSVRHPQASRRWGRLAPRLALGGRSSPRASAATSPRRGAHCVLPVPVAFLLPLRTGTHRGRPDLCPTPVTSSSVRPTPAALATWSLPLRPLWVPVLAGV